MRKDGTNGNYLPYDEKLDGHKINVVAVKRDTVFVLENTILIIMFYSDNPGVWTFHCHIDWHNLGGMGFVLVESPDLVRTKFTISNEMKALCSY
jgi:iron transport multicopper oxidase